MARVGMQEFTEKYLRELEKRIYRRQALTPDFSSEKLASALMSEMNRADKKTNTIEIPDNKEAALQEMEARVVGFIEKRA